MRLEFIQRIYSHIGRHAAERAARDLQLIMERRIAEQSVDFLEAHAANAAGLENGDAVLVLAAKEALKIRGCFCEFGVFQGRSLSALARVGADRNLHGFDSFEGLPEDWRAGFGRGAFRTSVPKFNSSRIELHKGWFDETVAPFVETLNEPIALAHIDCDLYSSTKTVFDAILPCLTVGSVLLFDEYFNYPGWQEHEHLALQERIAAGEIKVDFIAYNRCGQQLAAVVTGGTLIASHSATGGR